MIDVQSLETSLRQRFENEVSEFLVDRGELTLIVESKHWLEVCRALRDEEAYQFDQLVDLCGADYSAYGEVEWATEEPTAQGFSRGVMERATGRGADVVARYGDAPAGTRFAVVCHLVSYTHNARLRLRTFAPDDELPVVPSLIDIWPGVNWYEREAFDMFGIVFDGHPDLRRLLTDYGFVGHPFRKDFPLIGHVEMRYDPERERVVYEPVSIEPRVLVPRVVRDDHRYVEDGSQEGAGHG